MSAALKVPPLLAREAVTQPSEEKGRSALDLVRDMNAPFEMPNGTPVAVRWLALRVADLPGIRKLVAMVEFMRLNADVRQRFEAWWVGE